MTARLRSPNLPLGNYFVRSTASMSNSSTEQSPPGHHPPVSAGRLGFRLIGIISVTIATVPLSILSLGHEIATRVAGSFTWGMLLFGGQAIILLSSGFWYDRACSIQLDSPRAAAKPFDMGSDR
ncbi:hypothetical protein SSPO_010070 [Streptomyces antimycoticus]|uniref:Uncharacterized protein n=1 Tax=Streptomyces antimycoticus TaxID=68175 RepID=A0A499UMB6_9ACTN|nr:hypothetical protein SSPO_010070 [Streptomyces antimycoticus]